MISEFAGRRTFFRWLARETVVKSDAARGIPQLRLDGLGSLSDRKLRELIPAIAPGVEILPGERDVRAQLLPGKAPIRLFAKEEPSLFLFNRFNGRNSLGQIEQDLADEFGLHSAEAHATTRAFFLRMVQSRVCIPVNAAT